MLRNYGGGPPDVLACLDPLLGDADAAEALRVLRRDFLDHDAVGPRRAAEFLTGTLDDEIQADVVGFVKALLDACEAYSSKLSR